MLKWLKTKLPFVPRREYERIVAGYEDRGAHLEELKGKLDVAYKQRDDFVRFYNDSVKQAIALRRELADYKDAVAQINMIANAGRLEKWGGQQTHS